MQFDELTVTLKGRLWEIKEFEIETTDVITRWEEISDEEGCVKVKDFYVSDDEVLDIFIHLGAPNYTKYTVDVKGVFKLNGSDNEIEFSQDYEVIKNGKLRIQIQKEIEELKTA